MGVPRRVLVFLTGGLGLAAGALWLSAPVREQWLTSRHSQQEAAADGRWRPPRTSDGRPDLQGVWISRSATPLERPKALEGRTLLDEHEVAELQRRAARIFSTDASDFAAGDAVFLAALEDRERFKSPTSTHSSDDMIEREFDRRTSLVVDPEDGHIPPQTPDALRRRAVAAARAQQPSGPEDLTSALRCISWSVPRLGGRYGAGDLSYYRIVQTPDHVAIVFEVGHEARIVPLGGRAHLPAAIHQWNGDSRGYWEGDTLVIDTTNFSDGSSFMGASSGLHLVERFTRTADDTITYGMVIDDPTTWTRPWRAEMPLKRSGEALYEYACHEGNYDIITGILSAARADERRAAGIAR